MSEKSLTEQIKHYQKDIEKCPENTERMMRCIKRLYTMPIKVQHLQETGVGRSVNGLRKYEGQIGDAATALVAKWKRMVAAEDSDCEQEVDDCPEEDAEEDVSYQTHCNGDLSPLKENEHNVKDKENIRHNHSDRHRENDKSKKSKHSLSHEKDHSGRKDSSSKSHSKGNDLSKSRSSEKTERSSSKMEKSSEKTDRSVSKEKHSEKHSKSDHKKSEKKHSSKSNSSDSHYNKSKHKSSSKDRSESSRHHKEVKKESKSSHKSREHSSSSKHSKQDRYSDSDGDTKHEKRKHSSQIKCENSSKRPKFIKEEKVSEEEEEESERSDNESYEASVHSDEEVSSPARMSEEESNNEMSSDESDTSMQNSRLVKKEPTSDNESSDHSSIKDSRKSHSSRHKDKHKPEKKHQHSSHRSSSSKKETCKMSKTDLKTLIAENEKKIKKEKVEPEEKMGKPKSVKKIKVETNVDGSIDSGSGASFADALMGLDSVKGGKKKKIKPSSGSPNKALDPLPSSSHSSSPARSSSSSPTKSVKHTLDLMKEPDLLAKRPKLETLHLDISSTLPEINPNYKPLPYLPVKNRRTSNTVFDEEAMFNSMTTKNQRTKVYSGSKAGHYVSVPSLYNFCIQVLYDNIEGLEYTGGVPYEILKPLLEKLNAEQLLNLEHYNPYLVEDTDRLWSFHCKKDFRSAQRDDDESWRELYLRCMDEREVKLKRLTANITESMAKSTPVRQAKLAYVDTVAKPPRNIARKQAKYGTGSSSSSSAVASSSGSSSANLAAAASNAAKKKEIMSKAVVGGFTPATPATDVVTFNNPATASKLLKKKKAPLMAKALQLIKSNTRYKR